MSILNVKGIDILPTLNGTCLEKIFQLQEDLMLGYLEVEDDFPKWPLDLRQKKNHHFIRDLMGRIIEELVEASNTYEELSEVVLSNKKLAPGQLSEILATCNEELSDALHFFIELLIFITIDEGSIKSYYKKCAEENLIPESIYDEDNILGTALGYAMFCNNKMGLNLRGMNVKNIQPETYGFEDNNCTKGFRNFHPEYLNNLVQINWFLIRKLYTAQNKNLKNKPWKKQESDVNVGIFQLDLMEAFLAFMQLVVYLGLDEMAVYEIYAKKNAINLERQKNNY